MTLIDEHKRNRETDRNQEPECNGTSEEQPVLSTQGSSTHAREQIEPLSWLISFWPKHCKYRPSEPIKVQQSCRFCQSFLAKITAHGNS